MLLYAICFTLSNQIKIGMNVPHVTNKWNAIFQLEGQRSRSPKVKNSRNCRISGVHVHVYLKAADQARAVHHSSGADCKPIVIPSLLSAPEASRTAAYHVGTRCRHLFLFALILRLDTECALVKSIDAVKSIFTPRSVEEYMRTM